MDKIKNKELAEYIENIPRLIQAYNSIVRLPKEILENDKELKEISELDLPIPNNPCYPIPKLGIEESEVEILNIQNSNVIFQMVKPYLLENSIPTNTELQVVVDKYLWGIQVMYLYAYKSQHQYTPSMINYKVIGYERERNIGYAILENKPINLMNSNGVIYKFNTKDIGDKLEMYIKEAYIVM